MMHVANNVRASSELEPLWRRVVLTSLWGGLMLLDLIPEMFTRGERLEDILRGVLGLGLLSLLLLLAQCRMLLGWWRRLVSLAIAGCLLWIALMSAHHVGVGDPWKQPSFEIAFFFAMIASLFLIWRLRGWKPVSIVCLVLLPGAPWLPRLWSSKDQVPFSILLRDDLLFETPFWLGQSDDAAVGSFVFDVSNSDIPQEERAGIFQIIGSTTTRIKLPSDFWVSSIPWSDKVALGTNHSGSGENDDEPETLVQVIDAQGTSSIVEDIPDSPAAMAAMLTGWRYGSSDSPWRLIPVIDSLELSTRYDPDKNAIAARNEESGEERILHGLCASLIAGWRDADTMLAVKLEPQESVGQREDEQSYRAILLSVHVPSDTRTELSSIQIPDLKWVYHLSGDRWMIYQTTSDTEVLIVDWKTGEKAILSSDHIPGSFGLADTQRGLRMIFQEPDTGTGSLLYLHDGEKVIQSHSLSDASHIANPHISPDGAKVLFRRDKFPFSTGGRFPAISVEVWDTDQNEIVVLTERSFLASIMEATGFMPLYYWYRNPWSPTGREVLVAHMDLRWIRNRGMSSDLRLYHYEDWAEEKWGVRPTEEAGLNGSQ